MDADWINGNHYENCDGPGQFNIFMTPETHIHEKESFAGNTAPAGGASANPKHENRPPYYALIYIIKKY